MRRPVLVDTSALVALYLDADAEHKRAAGVLADFREDRRSLVATTDVFDETVTLVRRWGGYREAVRAGDSLRRSKILELVEVSDQDRETAWALFKEYNNVKLSFTDCTSAAVMSRLELEEVFTFDSDFREFGYKSIPNVV
jgi:predicted nucleic acid-binding protein